MGGRRLRAAYCDTNSDCQHSCGHPVSHENGDGGGAGLAVQHTHNHGQCRRFWPRTPSCIYSNTRRLGRACARMMGGRAREAGGGEAGTWGGVICGGLLGDCRTRVRRRRRRRRQRRDMREYTYQLSIEPGSTQAEYSVGRYAILSWFYTIYSVGRYTTMLSWKAARAAMDSGTGITGGGSG